MGAFQKESLADNAADMDIFLREALNLAFSLQEIPLILGLDNSLPSECMVVISLIGFLLCY